MEKVPENTLEAFNRAIDLGATSVEFDVMLTQDNVLVVFHDADLKRLVLSKKDVIAQTLYKDLQAIDMSNKYGSDYTSVKIPTLIETLENLAPKNVGINIEIKPAMGQEKETAIKTVEVLKENNSDLSKVLVSSFSVESLEKVRDLMPEIHLGLLLKALPGSGEAGEVLDKLKDLNASVLITDYKILKEDFVKKIKGEKIENRLSYKIGAYTVDKKEKVAELRSWEVDTIVTNHIEKFVTPTFIPKIGPQGV
jgi:glycerophosphoryl diester phosphodiesterase